MQQNEKLTEKIQFYVTEEDWEKAQRLIEMKKELARRLGFSARQSNSQLLRPILTKALDEAISEVEAKLEGVA